MRALLIALAALCLSALSAAAQGVTNVPCNQLPALTGDTTTSAASCATTTTKINGTDLTTAWGAFTPTFTCGTATFTNNSSTSKTIGKVTFVQIDATITAIGTCTTPITFTLPNTAAAGGDIPAEENVNSNASVNCLVAAASTTATCRKTANAAFLVNDRIIGSGVYQNQ